MGRRWGESGLGCPRGVMGSEAAERGRGQALWEGGALLGAAAQQPGVLWEELSQAAALKLGSLFPTHPPPHTCGSEGPVSEPTSGRGEQFREELGSDSQEERLVTHQETCRGRGRGLPGSSKPGRLALEARGLLSLWITGGLSSSLLLGTLGLIFSTQMRGGGIKDVDCDRAL